MQLGDYVEHAGGQCRCVRYAVQTTLHDDEELGLYLLHEKFYELKNCQNGRVEMVVESSQTETYNGVVDPSDHTAFKLNQVAIPKGV